MTVLAVDGLALSVVADLWPAAELEPIAAAHPTNSLPGWTTALTGHTVDEHGVAGVVVKLCEGDATVTNLLTHDGPLPGLPDGNVFRDVRLRGIPPFVIENDMVGWRGSVTRALTAGATVLPGRAQFRGHPKTVREIVTGLEKDIVDVLSRSPGPCLVWALVELDAWIHQVGYTGPVVETLTELGELAERLSSRGVDVVVHSDHGAVRTRHEPELAAGLDSLAGASSLGAGGAGRVRWLWPPASAEDRVVTRAERLFGSVATVLGRSEYLTEGSPAWHRIGSVVIEAVDESFVLLDPSIMYEHGSRLPDEVLTPLAHWVSG
ncbi:MAG: hypothetical protein CSA74_01790 [Rhodobacterales bacterium]|nr:MAG: hypothetical protein CSA74_01790 [Rhodobacterales bacterium]